MMWCRCEGEGFGKGAGGDVDDVDDEGRCFPSPFVPIPLRQAAPFAANKHAEQIFTQ